jgi:DNA-binding transcriptional LysR family regulator
MPHRRNIDIDLLRSFVTIVEVKSFTRAAERLLRTQSAISLQMKRLEEQLECRLFERGGRGVEPTQAGILLLGYARRILAANDELVGRMSEPLVEGTVALGAPEGFTTEHLSPILARFARAFPRVAMTVRTGPAGPLKAALAADKLDLVIESRLGGSGANDGDSLGREALLWCVADGAEPEALGAGDDEDRPEPRPLRLVLTTDPCPLRTAALAALDAARIPWHITLETSSRAGVQSAVGAGLGVGVLPRSSLLAGMHRLNSAEGLPGLPELETVLHLRPGAGMVAMRLRSFLVSVFAGHG